MNRPRKLALSLITPRYRRGLRHGVAPSLEHADVPWDADYSSVVDVGANRGQFALFALNSFPSATVHSFEPLPEALEVLGRLARSEHRLRIHPVAIGARSGDETLHVAAAGDSSSLLPITQLQTDLFPGTHEVGTATVPVLTLAEALSSTELQPPAMLKVDTQGTELEVLQGAGPILTSFATILVEASFLRFYEGQALASEIVAFLHGRGFALSGIQSLSRDNGGRSLQADFLFRPRGDGS